jgi:hypothetical protein
MLKTLIIATVLLPKFAIAPTIEISSLSHKLRS